MAQIADYIKENTSTTGTGTLTLVAEVGFTEFSDAFAEGTTVYYSIYNGNNRESGVGTVGAGKTLSRDIIHTTLVGGTYNDVSPTAITLAGSSEVIVSGTAALINSKIEADSTNILTNKTLTDGTNTVHANALHTKVKCVEVGGIPEGKAVMFSGYNQGEDAIEVVLGNNSVAPSIGITKESLANGSFGHIIMNGVLEKFDTSGYTEGQILYVNSSGNLTGTNPVIGYEQPIALVLKVHANNGAIQINAAYPKQDASDVRYNGTLTATNVKAALDELDVDKHNHDQNLNTTNDVTFNTVNNRDITTDGTKLDLISVTQAVNLDSIESDTATNNAKVTNATHTGDVTGSSALTITDDAVTYAKIQNVVANNVILGNDNGAGSEVQELTATEAKALLDIQQTDVTYDYGLPTINPTLNLDFANTANHDGTIDLDPRVTFERATTATTTDSRGRVVDIESGEPRVKYEDGVCKGLLIEEARTNLLSYSEDFTASDWIISRASLSTNVEVSPDGARTAVKIVEDSTASNTHQLSVGSLSITSGSTYTFSLFVKSAERTSISLSLYDGGFTNRERVKFDLSAVSTTVEYGTPDYFIYSVGNGWYRIGITATATTTSTGTLIIYLNNGASVAYTGDGTSGIYIWGAQLEQGSFPTTYIPSRPTFTSRASTGTYYDSNGVLQTAPIDVARYSYNPSDLTAPARLLVEGQRTNLLTYSEEFGNAVWGKANTTVTSNSITSPDGNITADKILETATTGAHHVSEPFSKTAQVYTASIYAKYLDRQYLDVGMSGVANWTGTPQVKFDLINGTVTLEGASSTGKMQDVGNGWYRCNITCESINTTASGLVIGASDDDTAKFPSYLGVATSGVYIWGAMLEESSYSSSYIPTTSSPVTRSADVTTSSATTRSADVAYMENENFSSWYNQDSGTILLKWNWDADSTATHGICTLRTDIPDSAVYCYKDHSTNITVRRAFPGASSASLASLPSTSSSNILSIGMQSEDSDISYNGSIVTNSNLELNLPNVNKLQIGTAHTTVQGRHIFQYLTFYDKKLTDTELQSLTTE